jgi:hypothetical protein
MKMKKQQVKMDQQLTMNKLMNKLLLLKFSIKKYIFYCLFGIKGDNIFFWE